MIDSCHYNSSSIVCSEIYGTMNPKGRNALGW